MGTLGQGVPAGPARFGEPGASSGPVSRLDHREWVREQYPHRAAREQAAGYVRPPARPCCHGEEGTREV